MKTISIGDEQIGENHENEIKKKKFAMIKEIYDSCRQVEHQLILPVSTNLQYSIYLRKKKKA